MHVLEAIDVRKTYREGPHEVPVLRGVSLSVARGEVVSLEGPSGSGKTTLLCILGCLLGASGGRVRIEGREVDSRRPGRLWSIRRRSIGFVFQQYNLFPSLTALENVIYALNLRGWRGGRARREAQRVLDAVGLAHRRSFRPRDLSGGQKQRVAIARALVNQPEVLLADEPTGALDTATGQEIGRLLRELNEGGQTLVLVTHDPALAERYAARTVRIVDGQLAGVPAGVSR